MSSILDYDFYAYPNICSGLKALDTIPRELLSFQASNPLILKYQKDPSRLERQLKAACCTSQIVLGPICRIPENLSKDDISTIVDTMKESSVDSIIAMGSGTIQSVAKLVNSLYCCDFALEEIESLPCDSFTPLPHIAVLDERIDGREATNRLLLDEYRLHHDSLYPEYIVIDERMMASGRDKESAASAIISLTQTCEAYRDYLLTPVIASWTKSSLHFLGEYQSMSTKQAKIALINAAVATQIAHSNIPPGPVTTISEMLAISGFCSEAQAMATLLPHFLSQLTFDKGSPLDESFDEIAMICSDVPWNDIQQMISELLKNYERYIHCSKTSGIITSLIRQTHRLMQHSNNTEIHTLITDLVSHTTSQTVMGGEL